MASRVGYKPDPWTDPNYRGEKTHKKLRDGPLQKRGCTDCFCLLVFAAFWVGAIFIAIYGFTVGNPKALIAPYNSQGHACGIGQNQQYPYLFWIEQTNKTLVPSQTCCVTKCPESVTDTVDPSPDTNKSTTLVAYPTITVGGRLCVPPINNSLYTYLNVSGVLAINALQQGMTDLTTAWWVILVVAGVSLVVGFIYMILMRFCSGVVTWGLIIFYFIALLGIGTLCYLQAINPNFSLGPALFKDLGATTLSIIAYVCWGVAAISLIVFIFVFRKIELAIAVLKCSSEFVESVPTSLLIPPFFMFLSLLFYIYWTFASIYILGTNQITGAKNQLPFAEVTYNNSSVGMFIYYIFALLWNHAFLAALPQFVIASACCIWYFSQNSKKKTSPVGTSICRGLFLHLGSIAFGSFLIAMIDFFRLLIGYFESHMRAARDNQEENCCARYCLSCSNCCLECFERFVKFINRHAYIQIAMTGESFCTATREAFFLNLRNATRFGVVHGIGTLFVFIGQLFIAFIGTLAGYLIVSQTQYFQANLYSPIPTTIICGLVSLIIAHVFMSVYGVSADTIVHCYCMDEEMHEGGPQNAPPLLKEFVNKHVPHKLLS